MTDPAIIEAAARALYLRRFPDGRFVFSEHVDCCGVTCDHARAIEDAQIVAPMIKAAALEEAAKVAAIWLSAGEIQLRAGEMTAQELRVAKAVAKAIHGGIRALKQPAESSAA